MVDRVPRDVIGGSTSVGIGGSAASLLTEEVVEAVAGELFTLGFKSFAPSRSPSVTDVVVEREKDAEEGTSAISDDGVKTIVAAIVDVAGVSEAAVEADVEDPRTSRQTIPSSLCASWRSSIWQLTQIHCKNSRTNGTLLQGQ